MGNYNPPVGRLITLGEIPFGKEWPDYRSHGIGPEHIPELIRLVQDKELVLKPEENPEVYAQVHAWRVLGQLRAEAAVEPLLEILSEQEHIDWDDWITEEVPKVLGMIGPPALAATATRLEMERRNEDTPCYYAAALGEIATRHPETREEVVNQLTAYLDHAREHDPSMNGLIIAELLNLNAVEAWPVIEKAFATDNVDIMMAGDAADAKHQLGLGPKPPPRARPALVNRMASGPTAKERAEARARHQKAEKRKNKKKRKGH
jgi:hypothetical protein